MKLWRLAFKKTIMATKFDNVQLAVVNDKCEIRADSSKTVRLELQVEQTKVFIKVYDGKNVIICLHDTNNYFKSSGLSRFFVEVVQNCSRSFTLNLHYSGCV